MEAKLNSKMREIMVTSWKEWHGSTIDDFPNVNLSYEKGFNAACEKLIPLLEASAPAVFSNAEASHMMDGLRCRQKLPCDELVERIKAVMEI